MKWFQHDADANRDPKIEKLLMRYGADGYALYFLCLELITAPIDRNRLSFELEHDAEYLSARLKIDTRRVEEIMGYLVRLGLFEYEQKTGQITCLKLALRLENSIVKNAELGRVKTKVKAKLDQYKIGKTESAKKHLGWSGIIRDDPVLSRTDIDVYANDATLVSIEPLTRKKHFEYQPGDETVKIDNRFLDSLRNEGGEQ